MTNIDGIRQEIINLIKGKVPSDDQKLWDDFISSITDESFLSIIKDCLVSSDGDVELITKYLKFEIESQKHGKVLTADDRISAIKGMLASN